MELFALITMFCIFALLQHLSHWIFDMGGLEILGSFFIVISFFIGIIIYDWSYKYKSKQVKNPAEYQMIATDSGYIFYDYERKVGFIPLGNTKLDTLIYNDNQ